MPFCRLDPNADPVAEAERCLARGARGIKLHPRAEQFTLDHPEVERLFALADERRLPILVHAGSRHPGARPARLRADRRATRMRA